MLSYYELNWVGVDALAYLLAFVKSKNPPSLFPKWSGLKAESNKFDRLKYEKYLSYWHDGFGKNFDGSRAIRAFENASD